MNAEGSPSASVVAPPFCTVLNVADPALHVPSSFLLA
jgi:hypothetical protein